MKKIRPWIIIGWFGAFNLLVALVITYFWVATGNSIVGDRIIVLYFIAAILSMGLIDYTNS